MSSRVEDLLASEEVQELLALAHVAATGPGMMALGPLSLAPSFVGTKFPGALDDSASLPTQASGEVITSQETNNQSAAIKAIETKLGINGSVDTTSVEYVLKNATGGHSHNGTNSRRVTYTDLLSIPTTFAAAAHGAAAHSGDVLPLASNQLFGAGSLNIVGRVASGVSTPASGRTIFVDSADGQLKVKTTTGTLVSLETGTGSGGGGAPLDSTYLVATADATLSNEVVVGATPGGELGGTWAAPTVDDLHAGVAHSVMARRNAANTFTTGENIFAAGAAGTKALIARGAVSQTANLQEWQDSSLGALASVSSAGVFTFPTAQFAIAGASAPGDTAAAGAAGTLSRSDHRHSRESPGTGSSIADVGSVSAAGVLGTFPRTDHVHGHGSGYLPDAHHTQSHSDADHSGASRTTIWDHDALRGTRPTINFRTGAFQATDNPGGDRVDIDFQPNPWFFRAAGNFTWTSMPAALTPFSGTLRAHVLEVDLRYVTEAKLFVSVTGTPGSTGSGLQVRYSLTDSNVAGDYVPLAATGTLRAPITTANQVLTSAWVPIPAAAKAEVVHVALFGDGGNGSVSPQLGPIWMAVR